MKQRQLKWGIIFSYISIILNTLYGLFLTPYMVGCLGEAEYGVYKTIAALTAALMIMDMGIGSTVMRYVAKYKASGEDEKIPNFVAMNLIQATILSGGILLVGAGVFQTIEPIYSESFTADQITKAKLLFVLLLGNMILHVFENVFNGVITGHNQFVFGNGTKVLRILLRSALIVAMLNIFKNSVALVLIDIAITVLFLIVELCYIKLALNVKIKFSKWEKHVFLESGKYTLLMFLTSIAAQVNNNLDNVVIGSLSGPELVTIYSMGLLIFGMFESLSTAVSGVMLPTVTNILTNDKTGDEIKKLVVKVGLLQFMTMGAAATGFILVGKDFINLWLGEGYSDVYIITLILIIPAMLELCVNVCLSILRAKNQLGFRTAILFSSTILNFVVTYIAVKHWSYIGAALGTATSFIVGSVIIMNVYYKKKLGLPMLRIYGQIFNRTWVCLIIAGAALWGFMQFFNGTLLSFIASVVLFIAVYGGSLIVYGFKPEEKRILKIGGKNG